MDDGSLLAAAERWRDADPDPVTRDALEALLARRDLAALHDLFDDPLGFGTAGIRGPLGPGPARVNRVLVRRVAAGLAAHLGADRSPRHTVVVGHDARYRSADFARDAVEVLSSSGIDVVGLDGAVPTPLLAFAARHLGADAAVMVTASHNPAGDNGVKVYLEGGIQVVPPADRALAAAIATDPGAPAPGGGLVGTVRAAGGEVRDAYLDAVAALVEHPPGRPVQVVYTPLHGVGADLTMAAFARAGLAAPSPVPTQVGPDPAFPTVAVPNPEDPATLDLAVAQARRDGADLVLAHDPDADRLAVAVPARGSEGWRVLSGDEIGALLADHLLARGSGADRVVVDTVVASALVGRIAAAHGVHHLRTAPGFKWVMRPVLTRPELRFVFGYEPALGYAVGAHVLDKDGIAAAAVLVELVGALAERGLTVCDRLDDLALEHGLHVGDVWARPAPVGAGPGWPHRVMDRLRAAPPARLADLAVERIEDLVGGPVGEAADMVVLHVAGGVRVAIRPSGTEPLLKHYAEVVVPVGDRQRLAQARTDGRRRVGDVRRALDQLWV